MKENTRAFIYLVVIIVLLIGLGMLLGAKFFPKEVIISEVEKECEDLGGKLEMSFRIGKTHECVKTEVLFTK